MGEGISTVAQKGQHKQKKKAQTKKSTSPNINRKRKQKRAHHQRKKEYASKNSTTQIKKAQRKQKSTTQIKKQNANKNAEHTKIQKVTQRL